ncbi:hypothetical protein LAZ67_X004237, partial [Cordylochernes scorpioides]
MGLNKGAWVLFVALDIDGVFNSMSWNKLMRNLMDMGCPDNLCSLVRDFLRDRRISLSFGGRKLERNCARGCPRGFCCGPILWNILVNTVFQEELPEGARLVLYADDQFLIIEAASRAKAEKAWWRRNRDQKVTTTLERVQRTAALRITGGYRTTSSEALLVLAGLIPLGLKLEEETIRQKIWENREDALGLEEGALESKRDPRKPLQWLPKWNWSPGGPTGIGTEVFTDGSKSGTNTGAGVVIFTNGELIFQESLTLRVDELVFSAELVAIREALRVCAEKNFGPDRLYSDCMSALVAINLEKGQLAHQIIQELEMMTRAPELPRFRRHSLIEVLRQFSSFPGVIENIKKSFSLPILLKFDIIRPWIPSGPGVLFRIFKSLRSKNRNLGLPLIDNLPDHLKTDKIKSLMNDLFQDDIGGLDKDDHILIRNYTPKYKNKSSVYIESKEIEETILKTNIKKAPGPDYISNNRIRQAKIKIIPILHKLFNKCIEMGYYPDEWKKSFLKIIPKPGKTNYEINKSYRPISLTSNLSKTFENIIKNKLSNYYLENNLMSSRQHGFMKSRSTITGMDKIIETILKHKQKELTSLIAIDIAGAFDNAWWPAIIKRMDNDDVPSDLIRIIKSYLNNEREVKFTYESETFYKKLTKGCPQGGPLSPLLWNILLNDLLINFDSMNADIICYADDVTIICWNKTIEGLKTASEYTLNYVIQWCNRNKLTISTEKTNMLYLHNKQKIPIKVNNNIIMPVKQVKILGMKFSNHKWKNEVNFTPHVNDILCKAGRMKNLLCSLSGNMWGLDTQKRLTLFKTIIRPVLTYGSEIWFKYLNNRCKQKLNSMQYQIILWAVRAYKTTSSNCVHSLAKIPLLTDYIESRIIKFDLAQLSIEDLITYEPMRQVNNDINRKPLANRRHIRLRECFKHDVELELGRKDAVNCECRHQAKLGNRCSNYPR